jgi:hypothetical protein
VTSLQLWQNVWYMNTVWELKYVPTHMKAVFAYGTVTYDLPYCGGGCRSGTHRSARNQRWMPISRALETGSHAAKVNNDLKPVVIIQSCSLPVPLNLLAVMQWPAPQMASPARARRHLNVDPATCRSHLRPGLWAVRACRTTFSAASRVQEVRFCIKVTAYDARHQSRDTNEQNLSSIIAMLTPIPNRNA